MRTEGTIVLVAMWWARNKLVFDHRETPPQILLDRTVSMHQFICLAFGLEDNFAGVAHLPRQVQWQRGSEDTMVLNVDGSALTNPGPAGFGGLIRNHDRIFLQGFHGSVGISNILHAELMALYHGVKLCWDVGFRKVFCFSDSSLVIQLVQQGVSEFHHYNSVVSRIKAYVNQDWEFSLHHIFREGNQCADFLAKLRVHLRWICMFSRTHLQEWVTFSLWME